MTSVSKNHESVSARGAHGRDRARDCAAHRARAKAEPDAGPWAALLPVLACAVCPACLTTYAKVFSVLGVGFGLSELHHLVLLGVAIGASICLSAWRSWRTRRAWPISVAIAGSVLVVAGHAFTGLHLLEWAGVLVLLAGGLTEHFRLRRSRTVGEAVAA